VAKNSDKQPAGPASDAQGRSVVDPSINVRFEVDAAVKRLDDLNKAERRHNRDTIHAEAKHVRKIIKLRSEVAELRAAHADQLRTAEAGRIDAILLNVRDTAEITAAAAETRATTLATQVTSSADALRSQVAAAAQASNDTLDRRFGPIQASIEEIRKFQFETQGGKQQVVETRDAVADLKPLYDAVAALVASQQQLVGRGQQVVEKRADNNQIIAIAALFAAALGAIIVKLFGG
jgi:hypothetical protein